MVGSGIRASNLVSHLPPSCAFLHSVSGKASQLAHVHLSKGFDGISWRRWQGFATARTRLWFRGQSVMLIESTAFPS